MAAGGVSFVLQASGKVVDVELLGGREPLTLDRASEIVADETVDGFVWIGAVEPEQQELFELQRRFGLNELAVEDAFFVDRALAVEAKLGIRVSTNHDFRAATVFCRKP